MITPRDARYIIAIGAAVFLFCVGMAGLVS